jgi:hypothetical protein
MCHKSLHSNVVNTEATKAVFETLKSRMISAHVLLTPNTWHEAEFVVATDANKVGTAEALLQENTSGSLRPCAYWFKKQRLWNEI